MLKKLLKYDFKSLTKKLSVFYLIALGLGLLNRLASVAADKFPIFDLPAGLIFGLTVVVLIGVPIATFIIALKIYYTELVKDEGYLTHTLPVKKSDIILSKLISYLVMQTVSIIVSLIIIPIAFNIPNTLYNDLFELIKHIDTLYMVLILLSVIVSGILQILIIYAAIAFGQKRNGNRVAYSFIIGIIMYNINQVISAIFLFIPALFNRDFLNYFTESSEVMPPMSIMYSYFGTAIVVAIVMSIIYFRLTAKTFEKKLNLE